MGDFSSLGLFEGYGVELEYAVVSRGNLDVAPRVDALFRELSGDVDGPVPLGRLQAVPELPLHVVEVVAPEPSADLADLVEPCRQAVRRLDGALRSLEARLLPTGMHPWMDPRTELKLWPHRHGETFATLDRIFDARTHGLANIQAAQLNLSFANDLEFARLHGATRLLLPLIPALAASSPFVEGRRGEAYCNRLRAYRDKLRRVPALAGMLIPENWNDRRAYEDDLLSGLYRDLEALDPQRQLRGPWINDRGCIARFDRMALEIRLVDAQECVVADLAVLALLAAAIQGQVEERWSDLPRQRRFDTAELAALLDACVDTADETILDAPRYLEALGFPERGKARARDVWQHLIESLLPGALDDSPWTAPLRAYLDGGCLARRIVAACGTSPSRDRLAAIYDQLAESLVHDRPFLPPAHST